MCSFLPSQWPMQTNPQNVTLISTQSSQEHSCALPPIRGALVKHLTGHTVSHFKGVTSRIAWVSSCSFPLLLAIVCICVPWCDQACVFLHGSSYVDIHMCNSVGLLDFMEEWFFQENEKPKPTLVNGLDLLLWLRLAHVVRENEEKGIFHITNAQKVLPGGCRGDTVLNYKF